METISMEDFDAKAQELGSVGAALKWARENGYELPPANRELPPIADKGALAAAAEADAEQADADAEQADVDGALDYANVNLGQIKSDPGGFFKSLLAASQAADKRAAASAQRLYEEGRQRIMEKYAGPSQSERLFALSKAMLSPTDFPGFKGFLGNVTGALSENAKAAREAEQKREEQLFALQQAEAARAAARPRTLADFASKYNAATNAAAKANAPVRGIAVGNRLVNPYTNQDIEPPVGTIKTYKGRKYEYLGGGDQYDKNNWKEVR